MGEKVSMSKNKCKTRLKLIYLGSDHLLCQGAGVFGGRQQSAKMGGIIKNRGRPIKISGPKGAGEGPTIIFRFRKKYSSPDIANDHSLKN